MPTGPQMRDRIKGLRTYIEALHSTGLAVNKEKAARAEELLKVTEDVLATTAPDREHIADLQIAYIHGVVSNGKSGPENTVPWIFPKQRAMA